MAQQISLFPKAKKPPRNKHQLYAEQNVQCARLILAHPQEYGGAESAQAGWARRVIAEETECES